MLEAYGFYDLEQFLLVHDFIDGETVLLQQRHRAGLNTMRSLDCVSANGNFIWFDPVSAATVTSEAAHEGLNRNRGVPVAS